MEWRCTSRRGTLRFRVFFFHQQQRKEGRGNLQVCPCRRDEISQDTPQSQQEATHVEEYIPKRTIKTTPSNKNRRKREDGVRLCVSRQSNPCSAKWHKVAQRGQRGQRGQRDELTRMEAVGGRINTSVNANNLGNKKSEIRQERGTWRHSLEGRHGHSFWRDGMRRDENNTKEKEERMADGGGGEEDGGNGKGFFF
jgi:hypothetical protein